MNRDRAYLKKMIPTIPPVLDEIEEPLSVETTSIADTIADFLCRYLACEPYQLTVLSLWVIYTWCFQHFSTAAYLSIRSPEPQSGKSLCLELLELLCDSAWMSAGADPRTITNHLLTSDTRIRPGEGLIYRPPYTILLDDSHHAFHGSERQPLVAVFNSGARASGFYTRYQTEYCVFGPKAFAGNDPLPNSLASRCIPIMLHRKRPSAVLSRFHRGMPPDDAQGLLQRLAAWADDHDALLARAADTRPAGVPSGLAPHEQDCAEPLLHIADRIGGSWPEKARAALAAIFRLSDGSHSMQILGDVRAAFASRENPEYLSTRDLLTLIGMLEHRPWSAWSRNAGRRLGALLHPFGIVSHNVRVDSETVLRGYLLRDFQDAWERYLPDALGSVTDFSHATPSATEFAAIGVACSVKQIEAIFLYTWE